MEEKTSTEQLMNENALTEASDTAIAEYFDLVKCEYEIERAKKQSFENRAGLILALLGAVCIFLLEQIKIGEVLGLITATINFLILIKIVSGICAYIGFIYTIAMTIRTIAVQKHDNFEVKSINEDLLTEQRIGALCRIIFTYRDVIVQHRQKNEERAIAFQKSLIGVSIMLISILVYISIV